MSRVLGWEDKSIGDSKDEDLDFGEAKPAKKKRRRKIKGERAPEDLPWADMDADSAAPPEDQEESRVKKVAAQIGVSLDLECPVCRSLEPCECTEEDRSFQRRVRFCEDVKKVARCERCGCALSTIYVPRSNTEPPHELSHLVAYWSCVVCHSSSIAMVATGQAR